MNRFLEGTLIAICASGSPDEGEEGACGGVAGGRDIWDWPKPASERLEVVAGAKAEAVSGAETGSDVDLPEVGALNTIT